MSYKCKRYGCVKTALYRSGLNCHLCDAKQADRQGVIPIYSEPPTYFESADIGTGIGFRSGGGGDFGGGGAGGSWDSGGSSSGSSGDD